MKEMLFHIPFTNNTRENALWLQEIRRYIFVSAGASSERRFSSGYFFCCMSNFRENGWHCSGYFSCMSNFL